MASLTAHCRWPRRSAVIKPPGYSFTLFSNTLIPFAPTSSLKAARSAA